MHHWHTNRNLSNHFFASDEITRLVTNDGKAVVMGLSQASGMPSDDDEEREESHVPSYDNDESEESHVPSDDNDDHDSGRKADVSGSESEMEITTEPSPKPPKRPRLHVRRRLVTAQVDDAPVSIIMDEDTAGVINSIEVAPGVAHAILASREVSPREQYV